MSQDAAGTPPEYPAPAFQDAPGVWPPPPAYQQGGSWGSLPFPFNETSPLARWVAGLLIAHIVLDVVRIPFGFLHSSVGQIVSGLTAGLQGLVLLATGIVFFIWAYRSYKNLTAFGATGLRMTPGWVVVYFFIPILNLFRPYTAFKEIWQASTPGLPEGDCRAWKSSRTSPLLLAWWLLWLLKNVLENIIALATRDEAQNSFNVWLTEGDHVVSIVAAICAIAVVRAVTARQEAKWKELVALRPPQAYPIPGTEWLG